MRNASILFFLIFGICAGHLFGQNSENVERGKCLVWDKKFYVKYEADKNAVFTYLPKPEMTPEAIKNFKPEEIVIQMNLNEDGTITDVVYMGMFRHGMEGKIITSIRKIKFNPAQLNGKAVTQRAHVKYGIKKCENGRICTYAFEYTP